MGATLEEINELIQLAGSVGAAVILAMADRAMRRTNYCSEPKHGE
jgi:hypothetical protein